MMDVPSITTAWNTVRHSAVGIILVLVKMIIYIRPYILNILILNIIILN